MLTSQKSSIPLLRGLHMYVEIEFHLSRVCEKVQVAGSVRRKVNPVGDVEIVCIPKLREEKDPTDMFGKTKTINPVIEWIDTPGNHETSRIKGGNKHQQILYKGVQVDIFMTDAHEYGRMLAIRTGPEEYSKKIARRWTELGYHGIDGKLIHEQTGERAGPWHTEQEFYDWLGWHWVEPKIRA